MKYLSNLLKQGTAGLVFFASLDGYARDVINDNKVKQSDRLLQDAISKYNIAEKDFINKQDGIDLDNVDTIAKIGRIKECVNNVKHDVKELVDKTSIEYNYQAIDNSSKILSKSTINLIDEINKLSNKYNISDNSNKFLDDILGGYSTAELGVYLFLFVYEILL